jgi:Rieske Fe-S protein
MIAGGAVSLGAGFAVPLTQYAGNLREEPSPDYLEIAKDDYDLPPGKSKMLLYGRIPALLIKTPEPDSELRAFVAVCTHLDCTVSYLEKENCIFCACHEGYYDVDGNVTAGPPPAPLARFHMTFKADTLVIALEKENLEKAFAEAEG